MSITWQQSIGLDPQHLCDFKDNIESQKTQPSIIHQQINSRIKDDLEKLFNQAKLDNLEIKIVSGYRSFEKQLTIWNDKWRGYRPVYSKQGRPLNIDRMSSIEKYKSIALWSALPGLSRHHWGTDLDVFSKQAVEQGYNIQLIEEEFSKGGICEALNQWLDENLEKFGFFRPYKKYKGGVAVEPWHISHIKESQSILENFDFQTFREHLIKSDICEKEFIVEKLSHYKEYYFENISVSPSH
ncbi:MAG: LAS superfamily LD-carboxypeptidase LdcB [Polaribacter sp.]|jgi:LAS superfamily LD-carboxypeptidase LdcB